MTKIRAIQIDFYLLLEVYKNGEPEWEYNPGSYSDLEELSFEVIPNDIELAVIKARQIHIMGAAIAHYCNQVQALAIINPYFRHNKQAGIIKSTSPNYRV